MVRRALQSSSAGPGRGAHRGRGGFTLIELILVVAIIAILSSVAVPTFVRFQLRTRRTEAFVNTRGIATAEVAYEKLYDGYVQCGASPTTPLGRTAFPFDYSVAGWSDLEWRPDGNVRCHYSTQIFTNSKGSWVRAKGRCDLDGDDEDAEWWVDVDPRRTSSSSQHMVLRPSSATESGNLW